MRKLPAVVNIFIMSTLNASAQPAYTFTRYLERNGIPTTTIEKIIQDDDGYLWLASWSGLYRFDGINFVNYRTGQGDARTGGADDRLADLHHDAYGHIWLLSYSNTLYRFDCSDGEMEEPVNARIMSVFKLSDTDFRFVTAGGEILRSEYSRNGQSCSLVRYLDIPDGESVVRICKDSEGTVWTLTEHAIYRDTGKLTDSPGYCFFEGRDGLYFGSSAGKLLKYDGSALDTIDTGIPGRVELLAEIPGRHEFLTGSAGNLVCWNAGDGSVSGVKCDSWTNGRLQLQTDGFDNIWIYSDRGSLNWYDKDKMELLPFYNGSLQREWNAETYVNTVFADSQSNLWIAGSWGGLERASYNAGEFRLMRPDPRPEAPADANNVRAVFQGSTGLIYAATRDGKVYVSMEDKLLFRSGSYQIGPEGERAVRDLSNVLAANPDINVMVEGHTDNVPYTPNAYLKDNLDLSAKRATTVVRLLLENKAIQPSRIIAAGRGESLPVDPAKTAEARAKNRRTEIILTPKLDELMQIMEPTQ